MGGVIDITCGYCGKTLQYEKGKGGWYPGYVSEMERHILKEHVRISQIEVYDGYRHQVIVRAYIDPWKKDDPVPGRNFKAIITAEADHPPWTEYYKID